MSKKTLALAAALLATSTLSTVANAGGLRVGLGFGFPLGHFVAHEFQSDRGGGYSKPGCKKPVAVARSYDNDPPVRHVEAPVRKIKRAPKVEVAEAPAPRPRKIAKVVKDVAETPVIKTAKLEDNTTLSDAAPSIYVPETPPTADIKGTQATPTARTVTVEPDPAATAAAAQTTEPVKVELKTEPIKVETPKVEEVKPAKTAEVKTEPETKSKTETSKVQRLCRRFSAAIAGLIDVPCE